MTMPGGTAGDLATAASELSASEQRSSSDLPRVMHKRRMFCSSSTTSSRIRESFLVTSALLERNQLPYESFREVRWKQIQSSSNAPCALMAAAGRRIRNVHPSALALLQHR